MNAGNARLNYFASPAVGKISKTFMSVGMGLKASALPAATQELVALRVSQINGCAVCIDIHVKEAVALGETDVRLNLVTAWREAGSLFTDAERAALTLAEEGTRVADAAGGVSDETWEYAAKHYDEEQLTALVILVSFMNTVNRLNIITQQPLADYRAGQLDRMAAAAGEESA
ncbi:carboxymuconolactone decarboxylase family protein [Streptomyces sp. NPDC058665]|uniref:carboxymuconolactone decarboxylase family protein n=1 Tax=Streptomyces sp. NPDC058665 TaxID=3346586 RepID=UPI0036480C3A